MNARALVLTHFLQRYTKVPPLNERQCTKNEEGEERRGEETNFHCICV